MAASAGISAASGAGGVGALPGDNSAGHPGSGYSALSSSPLGSSSQYTPTSSISTAATISSLPATVRDQAWAQDLLHPSVAGPKLASYPNLNVLEHPIQTVNGQISPGYVAQPAPLGLTDYGLGKTTYAYNTSHIVGTVTLNTPPNVTQPGALGVIEPSLGGEHQGALGSLNEFGVQLNTIGSNLTIPGTGDQGYVWAQNVVNWNDSALHFVMDTWNFSLDAGGGWNLNSIYSACGTNTAGVNENLIANGGVLQCVKGNLPITASDYPITLSLYSNFSTNSNYRSQLVYGYSVTLGGVGTTMGGVVDTVVFNNTAPSWQSPSMPANVPANAINGFYPTPTFGPGSGFAQDAEIDIVGGIAGDNGVFGAINGTVTLQYSNASSGGWKNVPSAYNFGTDTGETSMGIADYWTASHTLSINEGPTMLYGLWNAEPQVSVASGDIHIAGSISPSYGFVFVSNTPPVTNPFAVSTERDNMSWLPTTSTGTFNTYLPPLTAPWTTTYYVQAFASGSKEYNGTVTGSTTSEAITLTASPNTLRAPLYMASNAQASALALAVGASASAPYTFNNLNVNVNFTFNHLNDYNFPSFEVFQATGLTNEVYVNNTYLGTDNGTSPLENDYISDGANGGSTGLLVPSPAILYGGYYYTSGIYLYYDTAPQVNDQELFSLGSGGSVIALWGDNDAFVNNTFVEGSSTGVWVGESLDSTVLNTFVFDTEVGVTDIGSTGTNVWGLTAQYADAAISALSSTDATYSWLNVSDAEGIVAGADYGPGYSYYYLPGTVGLTVNDLNVTDDALGANLTLSSGTTINNLDVWDPFTGDSQGLDLDATDGTTVNGLVANYASGFYLWNATDTTINNLVLENVTEYYQNSQVYASTNLVLNNPVIDDTWYIGFGEGLGVYGEYDTGVTVSNGNVIDMYGGIIFEYTNGFTGTNVNSTDSEFSYEMDYSSGVSVNGVNAQDDYIGFNLYETSSSTVTNVIANATGDVNGYSAGVASYDTTGNAISNVVASNDSIGVDVDYGSNGNTVSTVTSESFSLGVAVRSATGNTITMVTVTGSSVGVLVDPSSQTTISDLTVSDTSLGVYNYESDWTSVSTVALTDLSVAIYSYGSSWTSVSGVTATNTTVSGPWVQDNPFSLPAIAAIVTYENDYSSISNVQTTNYPAALYDDDSGYTTVDNLNATGGAYGIVLNDSWYGTYTDIGAYKDWVGIQINGDSRYNVITSSAFVDCTSYAIAIYFGYYNLVWENTFIGNNGATDVYSSAHIQVYSGYGDYNYFNNDGIGNYWADWHTYNSYGSLAPYPIGDDNYDYYPIGGPEGTTAVYFWEYGLQSGVTWSVTFNGATQSTANSWIVFYVLPGTYSFTTGAVTGYSVTPATGSVNALGYEVDNYLYFTALYNVTVSETGLAANTAWSATVGGMTLSGSTSTLVVPLGPGTYHYQVSPVAGYTASPASGMLTVTNAPYNLIVTFTKVTYAVTITESGLGSGTSWSATVTPTGGAGQTQTSTGTSITFYLANGSYSVQVGNVSGYSLSGASGSLNVNGAPTGYSATYSSTTSPSNVSTDTFNMWLAVAIALAVIALVIGLLAVFLRRRGNPPPSGGAPPS